MIKDPKNKHTPCGIKCEDEFCCTPKTCANFRDTGSTLESFRCDNSDKILKPGADKIKCPSGNCDDSMCCQNKTCERYSLNYERGYSQQLSRAIGYQCDNVDNIPNPSKKSAQCEAGICMDGDCCTAITCANCHYRKDYP